MEINKKKKIGMLLDVQFPPDTRVENEMRSLAEAGYEVYLLCYDFTGTKQTVEIFDTRIYIHRIKVSKQFHKKFNPLALTLPFYFSVWQKHTFEFIKKNELDAIHVHDLRLAQIGSRVKEKFNIPYVLDLHENLPAGLGVYAFSNSIVGKLVVSKKKWERYEKQQVNTADAVISVIEEMTQRIAHLGVKKNKIFTVPNYINLQTFDTETTDSCLTKKPTEVSLLYSGGFDAHRGLETLIDAMDLVQFQNPNIRLHLVGAGRTEADLKGLVERKRLSNILFYSWQPESKLPHLIESCDIGIVPHLKNDHTDYTIPHKLFQYLWKSKPVIVSNCKPLKRLVEEMECGFAFESGNEQDLADKILSLAREKRIRNDMGVRGKKYVKEKYNWGKSKKELLTLYKQISSG